MNRAVTGLVLGAALGAGALTGMHLGHDGPVRVTPVASHWQQQHVSDCAEMSAAAIIGALTGRTPSEASITAYASTLVDFDGTPSYSAADGTTPDAMVPLFAHYGLTAVPQTLSLAGLADALARGDHAQVIVNGETLWQQAWDSRQVPTKVPNHMVAVASVDMAGDVVHLVDSATMADEIVAVSTFKRAWATSGRYAILVTS